MKRLALVLVLPASCIPVTAPRPSSPGFAAPAGAGEVTTFPDWRLRSSSDVPVDGDLVSRPDYDDRAWTTVPRRSTVLGGLLAAGRYPDVHYSANMRDKINAGHFTVPWWYRRTFTTVPGDDSHTFLRLPGGIIPSAEIWLNGAKIAGPDDVAGAYPAHDFEIPLHAGTNALAIKVFRADSYEQFTLDFLDWSQPPPDNSMGVWRDVQLARTGPVSLHNARVITSLDVPSLETADLTIKAELTNHTSSDVDVVVRGRRPLVRSGRQQLRHQARPLVPELGRRAGVRDQRQAVPGARRRLDARPVPARRPATRAGRALVRPRPRPEHAAPAWA